MSMSQTPLPSSQGRHGGRRARGGRRAARRTQQRAPSGIGGPRNLRIYAIAGSAALSLYVAWDAGAFSKTFAFLDFGAGVLALVCLTSAVLWGLAATDQMILHTRQRLMAQAIHRAAAVAGLLFLAVHIWVKVAESHTNAASAVLPFADANQPVLIGLGTIAGYLFVIAAVTGAVRSSFASAGNSRWRYRWWRALHVGAYPAWCAALIHGLKAGRAAKIWATYGYIAALAGVAIALWLRLVQRRRQDIDRADGIEVRNPPARSMQEGRTRRADPTVPRQRAAEPGPRDSQPLGASRGWDR
ncbi:hypothetical protein HUF15_11115 [Streptomyces samsunensis]|nr:hypothetical protein CFP59_01734 [Streptomyces sp. M56]MYU14983.1 hypothetical protein [Streptomyces sp. SID8361]MYX62946.1 hypothetical protein [Streptomyces sp. SID8382]NUH37304.1 hypothetical protein [Streptomyces samsunensis]QDL69377.1 hypothetical protein DNK48_08145 [Streptomyces malaysiensis]SCG07991.1 hypothetical protein GA0115260_108963 [Streptomyces sp. MnatMP-M27]